MNQFPSLSSIVNKKVGNRKTKPSVIISTFSTRKTTQGSKWVHQKILTCANWDLFDVSDSDTYPICLFF